MVLNSQKSTLLPKCKNSQHVPPDPTIKKHFNELSSLKIFSKIVQSQKTSADIPVEGPLLGKACHSGQKAFPVQRGAS